MASAQFTITVNTTADGPFSLYTILSTGLAPTGTTLGVGASITPFTAKPIAYVSVQNVSGGTVYLGDSTLTGSTNMGLQLPTGAVQTMISTGGSAWANSIYFNASAGSTIINFTVFYAT